MKNLSLFVDNILNTLSDLLRWVVMA